MLAIRKYRSKTENIHNFNENRFIIRIVITFTQAKNLKEIKNKRIIKASQAKHKQFVLFLATT